MTNKEIILNYINNNMDSITNGIHEVEDTDIIILLNNMESYNTYRHNISRVKIDGEDLIPIDINGEVYCIYKFTCEDCSNSTYYIFNSDDINSIIEVLRENDKINEINGDYFVCGSCYSDYRTCYHCDNEFYYEEGYYDNEGRFFCESCRDNHLTWCDHCEEYYYDGDYNTHYVEEVNECYCDDCYNNYYENRSQIDGYHCYSRGFAEYNTNDEQSNNIFYGIELEIENNDYNCDHEQHARYIKNNLHCICARDGSLNNGFELISDKQSFNYWLSRKDNIKDGFDYLRQNGYISNDSNHCGLHIHVSRKAIGETLEEQTNTIAILELIIENFKNELMAFSRRRDYGYCRFLSDTRHGENLELSIDKIKNIKKMDGERYRVLNTNPTNTIEFRLFKGSLNIQTFIASIQLVHNLIELATSGDYVGKTWNQLINMNHYDELINYNTTRNIHSKVRIKDHTEQIRLKQLISDRKMIALKSNLHDIMQQYNNYITTISEDLKNFDLLNSYINLNTTSTLGYSLKFIREVNNQFIQHDDESITNIKYENYSKYYNELINKIDRLNDIRYNQKTYTTLDGETIYYYDINNLKELINNVKKAYDDLKKYYSEEVDSQCA